MAKGKNNRLAHLFGEMSNTYELPHSIAPDHLEAEVGIPVGNDLVHASYIFGETEDDYEFGAALLDLNGTNVSQFAEKLLRGASIPGITERINEDNKFYVSGGRNGVSGWGDEDVKYGYMDDLARIAEAYELSKQVLDDLAEDD